MTDQSIQYNEEMVGGNHPTKPDTLNRLALIHHENDGTHKVSAYWAASGGTANAITATFSPAWAALTNGMMLFVKATAANTSTAPTFTPNGLAAKTIKKNGNQALVKGDIIGPDHELILRYNSGNDVWELLNPAYPGGQPVLQNLLTNSGWEIWSNSGLSQGITGRQTDFELGSDLTTNGNFDSGDTGWTKSTGVTIADQGGGDYEAVFTNVAIGGAVYQTVSGLTVGKLYKVVANCSDYTDGSMIAFAENQTVKGTAISATGTSSVIFEASATTSIIGADARTVNSNFRVDEISVFEVTPGCVAGDELGPDGWSKNTSGITVYREHNGSNAKDGSFYSLKIVTTSSGRGPEWGASSLLSRFQGRTVTFGAWVKATSVQVGLRLGDNTSSSYAWHTGGGGWEWLEVTFSMATLLTQMIVQLYADASTTFYTSQPMLVFGKSIGEGNYTRPQTEVIYFEKVVYSNTLNNKTGLSTIGATALNIEADSSGAIGKGVAAFQVNSTVRDSGSASADLQLYLSSDASIESAYNNNISGLANDSYSRISGWMRANSSGDTRYGITASGAGTFDISTFEYKAIQLR